LRQMAGAWYVALIEPRRDELQKVAPQSATKSRRGRRAVLSLPKGLVDPGEKPGVTAVREVYEETGLTAEAVVKLADIKYVYVRTWGGGERVFKIVSFYLMRYVAGEIGKITPEMQIEIKRALWVPLADASKLMAYSNERKVLQQAQEYLETHGSL